MSALGRFIRRRMCKAGRHAFVPWARVSRSKLIIGGRYDVFDMRTCASCGFIEYRPHRSEP